MRYATFGKNNLAVLQLFLAFFHICPATLDNEMIEYRILLKRSFEKVQIELLGHLSTLDRKQALLELNEVRAQVVDPKVPLAFAKVTFVSVRD
jgi:hypothetical protein